MNKKCMGCGSAFQSKEKELAGYISPSKYDSANYCERCFRLKHYHERKGSTLSLSNEEIFACALHYSVPVYYFVDLLNLSEESMRWFSKIKGKKTLVFTKIDIIPKSVSLEKIVSRIRLLYHVTEDIIPVSIKRNNTFNRLWNHILESGEKRVLFLGMTNVGKSSVLNQLSLIKSNVVSPILVSDMPNTTQSFLSWNIDDITIYDAPGFNYSMMYEGEFQYSSSFKNAMRPITHPMKKETKLNFQTYLLLSQSCDKNYVTYYGSNHYSFTKQYQDEPSFLYQEVIPILDYQDLVLPGVGFFQFRYKTNVTLCSSKKIFFEIRNSLIGGNYDSN